MRPNTVLNVCQIAAALGVSTATASRAASRGEYGKPVIKTRRKFYPLAAIEKVTGRHFTPYEIESALKARDYAGPTLGQVMHSILVCLLKLRDQQWRAALSAQGITEFTPPVPLKSKKEFL